MVIANKQSFNVSFVTVTADVIGRRNTNASSIS